MYEQLAHDPSNKNPNILEMFVAVVFTSYIFKKKLSQSTHIF